MRTIPSFMAFAAGAGLLLTLSGCDQVEQSAQQLLERTEEVAKEKAREVLSKTVEQLNQSVDEAQQSANELLKPETQQAPEAPTKDAPPLPPTGQMES